ncbi:hypothetical protein EX30DRAFT_221988 [Ascodesmis nigricans]|uniref:Uncharacterized protein n=1 Tax=Ascodesmis nigricans TaxID=341454 RepID=A0A4S2MZZ7_9PEZI|nr:hypothetical protein EX30DRAFT_221988 [Ascodesmis nigricans]
MLWTIVPSHRLIVIIIFHGSAPTATCPNTISFHQSPSSPLPHFCNTRIIFRFHTPTPALVPQPPLPTASTASTPSVPSATETINSYIVIVCVIVYAIGLWWYTRSAGLEAGWRGEGRRTGDN